MPNQKFRLRYRVQAGRCIVCLLLCISLCLSPCVPARVSAEPCTETSGQNHYPFCSEYNLYMRSGKKIEQRALDGGTLLSSCKVKHLKELWWVDHGWIYYSIKPTSRSVEELWRVPLSQVEGGMEQILWEEKEKLLTDEYINALCISGSYIVYSGNITFYRYDLQQKTKRALGYRGKQKFIAHAEFISQLQNVPLVKDGFVFLGDPHFEKYFYCLDIERWKLQKISERKLFYDQLIATQNAFFYVSGDKIWKYDPSTNTSALFIEKTAIDKEVQASNPSLSGKKVKWGIHSMFDDHDRVYLQIYTHWTKKQQDHDCMILLSFEQDTPFRLQYEKGLTDCLREKSTVQYQRQFDITAESGELCYMVDGNCILMLYADAKPGKKRYTIRDGYYSLRTGEFKYITKEDAEYYYPYYIGAYQKHDCPMGYE